MNKAFMKATAVLAFVLGIGFAVVLHAEEVGPKKYINGTWLVIENYGQPNSEGWQPSVDVRAQQAAYTAAKKSGDFQGKVDNAFWTSVQAWAYNNAGYAKLKAADWAGAKELLLQGQVVLNDGGALGEGANAAQVKAFEGEEAQRSAVSAKLAKNLLFVQRNLGEKPWPKKNDVGDE